MEKENHQSAMDVVMETLIDSGGRCDARKILDNEDNYFFDDDTVDTTNYSLNEHEQIDTDDSNSSNESEIVLQQKHRNVLRMCGIWRRKNIKNLKNDMTKQKTESKIIMHNNIPEIEKIEENEFVLGNMIESAKNFIEGKCLVFSKNESEDKQNDEKETQALLFEIENQFNLINTQFLDIDEQFKIIIEKGDILEKNDDILTLREQTFDILKKKDNIINELLDKLKELLTKLLYEALNNSDDLLKLNEVATRKIKILKEEHEKFNLNLAEMIDEKINENIKLDSAKCKDHMNKILEKILSSTVNQQKLIEKNYREFKQKRENTENFREDNCGKHIRIDADFEMVNVTCLENIEKLNNGRYILKKTIEENANYVFNQRRQFFSLQELVNKKQEKYNNLDSDNKIQMSIIKKKIIKTNELINNQMIKNDSMRKKADDLFLKIWDSRQNAIIHGINNVYQIDDFIHEFLSIDKAPDLREEHVIDESPQLQNINNLVALNYPHKDAISNSYNRLRDNALNQLLFDFIVKNSSFVNDFNFKVIDTNLKQNFEYTYNSLSALGFNIKMWNLLKSEYKQFVTCDVCNTKVLWEMNETIEDSNSVLEEKICTNINSDNNCAKDLKSSESLFEKLCNHINQHNESIEKVKKSNLDQLLFNPNNTNYSNSVIESIDEEHSDKYSTEIINNDIPKSYEECRNINHQLSMTIDEKYYISSIEEIIKNKGLKDFSKPKTSNEYKCTWKWSENDLRAYWTQFKKYIPSSTNEWHSFQYSIQCYGDALVAHQNCLSRTNKIQDENKKLKQILYQLKEICLLKNIT